VRIRRLGCSLAVVAALVAIAGCNDDSDGSAPAPAPEPKLEQAPRRAETAQPVPKLPPGWKVHANHPGGFAFGLPPGWKPRNTGKRTLVRSFDRLVSVEITSDRTVAGLDTPLDAFATRALAALPGFGLELEPGRPRRFRHRYKGVEARASGVAARTGVSLRVRLVVLRRDSIVTFTAVIAANAKPASRPAERLAERMLRTLRSRPIRAPEGSGSP
jgi:hypothetical protein